MRLVVTSDTHRRARDFMNIIERHLPNADLFINLGDSQSEIEDIELFYPQIKLVAVAGNCDFGSTLPFYRTITFADKTVFLTHGHPFYVKHGYEMLQQKASEEHADICLFGHTHTPYIETVDGIFYMNPGAVCDGYYGVIDIENGKIFGYHNRI